MPELIGEYLIRRLAGREPADALVGARANPDSCTLTHVMLPRDDHSPALRRLTASLAGRVGRGKA